MQPYVYKATVKKVIDGDSIRVNLDMGFGRWDKGVSIRLYGINAWEKRGEHKEKGMLAKKFVEEWLDKNCKNEEGVITIVVKSYKEKRKGYDNFGRYLFEIFSEKQEQSLNNALLENGHAVPYIP